MTDLRDAAADYLGVRRALGFKLIETERLLGQFLDHLDQRDVTTVTTVEALAWATSPTAATPWWWRLRLSVVRGFARHLAAFDPAAEVPPVGLIPAVAPRAKPYWFSDADVAAVMRADGGLQSPLRKATYRTLIGLLAVTGMRVGEAITLNDDDVDLDEGRVVVRGAKFGKSRELVVHPTTTEALVSYRELRQRCCLSPVTTAFFVSTVGTRLHYSNVSVVFRRLASEAGLGSRTPGCRPTLHSLRHSFAMRTVTGWYEAGLDVGPLLPLLSTYLGHTKPADTYWYLTATPELLALAARRLEISSGVSS